MRDRNFFEKMTLQIPLNPSDVATFYSLPLMDQEILIDDAKTFVSTKMAALRAIAPNPKSLLDTPNTGVQVPLVDPPDFIPAGKLKSSYSPPEKGCIRRI